ncbi:hypothetical protein SAMN06295945_1421 [Polynucleobacter meluiroseus]|uniref:Uncharacterized protein n=1 Tax=Polynucleobacter meluiroseus TaxID=1938814 RepID=A0A240E0T6_9BURK|nr:hypothetical protein [Polynucleobacter meluiroseus]SNX29058.1 hypothetical protein SAMN06295945_1421 [Polynucleobacter meluiroseus]
MILAWVFSLLVLLSSLLASIERMSALEVVGVNTLVDAQARFILAENKVSGCESDLANLLIQQNPACDIFAAGKQRWIIANKEVPYLEVLVSLDPKTGATHRLHWRQDFE